MVSRETRTTPKTDRLPRDFDPYAKGLNTILDHLTWQQAGDYGQRALKAGWEGLKGGAGTLQDALNTPISEVDWADAARGLGTGLRQAGEGFLSLPGAGVDATDILRDMLAQRMGYTPEQSAAFGRGMDRINPLMPLARDFDVEGLSKQYIGDYYKPKTPLGKVTEFGGSMADPTIALPGGTAYKAMRRLF
jgi:hypothetical protein